MAKSYLLNPDDFHPGEIYQIEGDPGAYFKIDYIMVYLHGDTDYEMVKIKRSTAYFDVNEITVRIITSSLYEW